MRTKICSISTTSPKYTGRPSSKCIQGVLFCFERSYEEDRTYIIAKNLVKQIRSGRKVFKLLKFVEIYKEFIYLAGDNKANELWDTLKSVWSTRQISANSYEVLDNTIKIVIKLSGFFYYMLDNMLWVVNVGVISKRVALYSTMKSWKNIFSLVYNYFQMFRSIIGLFKAKQKLRSIMKEMELHKREVVGTTSLKATEIVRRYIN